jgi:L-alanine-DL-glutamate epimerase-like enolase superfamily enzyme
MKTKIVRAEAFPVELQLKEPFVIANETTEVADNIFIRLQTETGIVGWGCSTPDAVTSETKDTVLRSFEVAKRLVVGCDPTRVNLVNFALEGELEGNPSLKAGVNMALYDVVGKMAGMPLFRIDVEQDIQNILAIREAVGSAVKLRLDANEGYSVEDALMFVKTLEEKGADIEILEQPTKANYLYSLKDVTYQCSVPIMADETALTLRDSVKLVKLEIADMINIKLMKIGGITNAIKANALAELAKVPVMAGCMNESMAAMSAGVHFACAFKNVEYADLDSALDFVSDVAKGGARYEDGYVIPSEKPGLGVEVQL